MVSSINYGAVSPQYSSFQDLVNRPQTYAEKPAGATGIASTQKKGKAGKIILGTAATAVAVAGGMVAVNKFAPEIKKLLGKIKNEQIKTFLEAGTDKVAGWGGSVANNATKVWNWGKTELSKLPQKINDGIEWCKNKLSNLQSNTPPAQ